jgi:hypothetical protein
MKEIKLTRGKVALVDDEDYERFGHLKWHCVVSTENNMRAVRRVNSAAIMLHREIMGATKGQLVDHKNGDGLDNRRENLRFATRLENSQNRRMSKNNTSGFKGVTFDKKGRRHWRASIGHLYTKKESYRYLGLYFTPLEAAIAYDLAALRIHGEFAFTNVIKRIPLETKRK